MKKEKKLWKILYFILLMESYFYRSSTWKLNWNPFTSSKSE